MSQDQAMVTVELLPARGETPPTEHWHGAFARVLTADASRRRVLRRALALGTAGLLAGSGVLLGLRRLYAAQIYPNVFVADVDLGGLDLTDARVALERRAQALDQRLVRFTYRDTTWSPSLRQLGVTVDVDRALSAAHDVGREPLAWDRLRATGSLMRGEIRLPLPLIWDQERLREWFDQVDGDLGAPPRDAVLEIDGAEVAIRPDAAGTGVDRETTTARIASSLRRLQPIDEPLPVVTMPPAVRAADLKEAERAIEAALAESVTVTFEDRSWLLEPVELSPFIAPRIDRGPSGVTVDVALDEEALGRWLEERLAAEIDRDPVDAVVAWNDRLIALEPSAAGVRLQSPMLAAAVAASFLGDHQPVEIPVAVIQPTVDSDNLDALGITTRLAVGDSAYVGSNAGRSTNIQVGAQLLNGTLVPPQSAFSFNHAIGVITTEKGYVEAAVIAGERIGRDIGGGICQVSTTVYRAALRAGVPIDEWWPHTYRLGFYELDGWLPGYDASILQPDGDPFSGGDFRFTNPSDHWLLVESYTADERVYVILYGPEFGYDVQLGEPWLSDPIPPPPTDLEIVDASLPAGTVEQTETAIEGLEVMHDRTVTDRSGQVVLADTWHTWFAPRPDVWKVSPDMQGRSPAAGSGG